MKKIAPLALVMLAASTTVIADEGYYVAGFTGISNVSDIDTEGNFNTDVTLGPPLAGAVVDAATPIDWNSSIDDGTNYGFIIGRNFYNNFAVELEVAMSSNDVTSHSSVSTLGLTLDDINSSLLTGADGPTIGEIVGAGTGNVDVDWYFVNAKYSVGLTEKLSAYAGAGLGMASVDVDYQPSGISVIDDSDSVFAYQAIIGLNYRFTDTIDGFVTAKYLDADTAEMSADSGDLLPIDYEFDVDSTDFQLGLKYKF